MTDQSKNPKELAADREKRRLPRLSVGHENFRLDENGKIFSIQDLTPQGLAILLIDSQDTVLFPVGRKVTGKISLYGAKFSVTASVTHVDSEKVGFEITEMDDENRRRFEEQISPEKLGASMRLMPHEHLESLWFHAPGGVDLLIYPDEEKPETFGFFFLLHFDRYVSGAPGEIQTGRVLASTSTGGETTLVRLENVELEADGTADDQQVEFARVLLSHAELPREARGWLAKALPNSDA